jgi:hypothetical protein
MSPLPGRPGPTVSPPSQSATDGSRLALARGTRRENLLARRIKGAYPSARPSRVNWRLADQGQAPSSNASSEDADPLGSVQYPASMSCVAVRP